MDDSKSIMSFRFHQLKSLMTDYQNGNVADSFDPNQKASDKSLHCLKLVTLFLNIKWNCVKQTSIFASQGY